MIIDAKRAALLADAGSGNLRAARRPRGRQGYTYFSETFTGPVDKTVEQMVTAKLLTRGARRGWWDTIPMELTATGARALADYQERNTK